MVTAAKRPSGAKILVVDDEPDMAALVKRKFSRSIHEGHYHFLFAEDGHDALRVLSAEPDIDLVVSDIKMPGMDGLSLLSRLEEVEPLLKTVIVTAYGDMDNIRTAMNRGAFDFVTKPIDFTDLEATIQRTLTFVRSVREAHQQRAASERERVTLARYFSPNVVEQLMINPMPLSLGVERREMSFVTTDLAGFTPMMEKFDASDVFPLLNQYFSSMVEIAFKHNGTIDKVVGDGINIFFGAPDEQPDHASRAVACALDMDNFATRFTRQKRREGISVGETRIGLNTGNVFVGNFGCDALLHYTAHGDVVNTAARLEAANKKLGTRVCVSDSTVAQVPEFAGLPIGELVLRGKSQRLTAYQPIEKSDIGSPSVEAYKQAYRLLEAGNTGAADAFASIVESYPDLSLAALHLRRFRAGDSGTTIVVSDL